MFVDSHCHLDRLDLSPYDNQLDKVLQEVAHHQVNHMLCVGIDLKTIPDLKAIAQHYPQVDLSIGLHPNETVSAEPSVDTLVTLAKDSQAVAIGETGLDYYRTEADLRPIQQQRFRNHIRAAIALNKPLIVHTRAAPEDTLRILQEEQAHQVGGVMHCFTETLDVAESAMALNFLISFSGIITFKNAGSIREVAQSIPLDRLLIETDAPYLAPVPFRGKPNVPTYVTYVAECLAELKGIDIGTLGKVTTDNYFQGFLKNQNDRLQASQTP